MRIRHADAGRDAAGCAAIYEPFVTASAVSFEETAPDASQFAARIELLSRSHAWLVADVDGELAGYAYGSPHRERAAYRWATEVTVYVAAAHRRRGVARALYERLFERLTDRGYVTTLAGITLPNEASVALHESLGFALVGIYHAIGHKAGAWRDVGWWQRQLVRELPESPQPPATSRRRNTR